MEKLEITTKPSKTSKENNTSNDMDENEESFQCEICDMKVRCKVSLGKHIQRSIPQFYKLMDQKILEKKDEIPALSAGMQGKYQTLVNVESGGPMELDLVGVTVLLVI